MADVRRLYELQLVDLELDRRHERLGVIRLALADKGSLATLQAKVREYEASEADATRRQNEFDQAIASFAQRIAREEEKMYSGKVANPRELSDLQAEVTQLQRQRSQEEDRLLAVMDELDSAHHSLTDASIEAQVEEERWQAEQQAMTAEQATLQDEVAKLTGRREAMAAQVSPADLSLYEQVRRAHQGRAVAMVRRGTCEVCRVGLPTGQLQALATSTAPVRCNNCGLILVAG